MNIKRSVNMAQASRRLCRGQEGQSLIEMALMVPIFTILVCYAVDFGFFFLAATSLNSAARNAICEITEATPPGSRSVLRRRAREWLSRAR